MNRLSDERVEQTERQTSERTNGYLMCVLFSKENAKKRKTK